MTLFPILGLTGPSGAGKGTFAQHLRDTHGFAWIDTDAIYHALISAPSPCLDELCTGFGDWILLPDGSLDRRALAAFVFDPDNKDKLKMLNRITHKHVLAVAAQQTEAARQGGAAGVMIDAPLLFESGADKACTHSVAVLADAQVRLARITARDGISENAAWLRLKAQPTDEFYTERADFVIYNNGNRDALHESADRLVKELL